jgi:hypothetical protein
MMKKIFMAAVAAVSLGMTGAAMASQPTVHHVGQQARNEQVSPQQRPAYLAGNNTVFPSQRPAYLASNGAQGNSVVLPSQRPAYLS